MITRPADLRLLDLIAPVMMLLLLGQGGGSAFAQDPAASVSTVSTNQPTEKAETPTEKSWAFSTSIYGYLVPDSRDYAQPTVTADRGALHLEARYNYENLDTGSIWVGYNLSGGEKLAWEITPMLGGVIGNMTGVAPGYKGSLSWWKLELYSEGEYVADAGDSTKNFFYNWSELTISPLDWFRVGMVTQRTRAYSSDREIQRGFLVGFSYRKVNFTTYVFNPDDSRPIIVLAAGAEF